MQRSQQPSFFDFTLDEMRKILFEKFQKKFRADQIFDWIYKKFEFNPANMHNISLADRTTLAEMFDFSVFKPTLVKESQDGTKKILFTLADKKQIETVFMPSNGRWTVCVSSQAGCGMGCKFCKTATMGFQRNLSTSEIIQQVLRVILDFKRPDNIVFMGMGEPLANYDNVVKAIQILVHQKALNFSWRSITVSTVGLEPKIKLFFEEKVPAQLAISLNASNQQVRSFLMPVSNKFSFEKIIETVKNLPLRRRQKIFIEYVLIDEINADDIHLNELIEALKVVRERIKINLIPFNEFADSEFRRPSLKIINRWHKKLKENRFISTVRWSKGVDILGGCGQLATKRI